MACDKCAQQRRMWRAQCTGGKLTRLSLIEGKQRSIGTAGGKRKSVSSSTACAKAAEGRQLSD